MASTTTTSSSSKVDRTVLSPRPFSFTPETRTRRLSLNIPNPPTRTPAVPVPARQGSIHRSRPSFSTSTNTGININANSNSPQDRRQGSSLSLSVSAGRGGWSGFGSSKEVGEKFGDDECLAIRLGDVSADQGGEVVSGDEGMERAVEVLLGSGKPCLLVDLGKEGYAFFDFSDLNVFLLLVLQAASSSPSLDSAGSGDRRGQIIKSLRGGGKVPVSSVCNISQKNPCHLLDPSSTMKDLIPLLASGIHRVLLNTTPPSILTASNVLEHLISKPPKFFNQTFLSPSLDIPLNPLISLYAQGSVLDAMQVMSLNNLSALGVLGESHRQVHRRTSSSSSSSRHVRVGSSSSFKPPSRSGSQVFNISPSIAPVSPGMELPSPFESGELINIMTAEGCGRLVVPSQGREALGMGLGEATKKLQVIECAGQERGEERVPVHTITCHSSILHASHLILATSSSRVFLRNPNMAQSPSISPTIPSPPSPSISISSLSLSDTGVSGREEKNQYSGLGLPIPPQTVYSPHYVVSITDILGALGRAYMLNPQASLGMGVGSSTTTTAPMGEGVGIDIGQDGKRTERSGSALTSAMRQAGGTEIAATGGGLESWKWAKEQGQDTARALA